jgi:cation diffusion facilitator family transporter
MDTMMLYRIPLAQRLMLLSIVAALGTLVLKFIAWRLTGSIGLFSDAAESLVNVFAATFALIALRVSALPPDDNHAFGHEKIEYLSAAFEGSLILVAAGTIIYSAISRFLDPAPVSELGWGLAVSVLASIINATVAVLMLRVARKEDSIVLEADAHHLLSDVWTSLGVVAALLLLMVFPTAHWLDPLVAILVALNILRTALDLIKRAADGLMDVALPPIEVDLLDRALKLRLPAHATIARLRTRKSGSRRFIEFNLLLPGEMTVAASHTLCDLLEDAIHAEFANSEVVIHVEPAA